MLEKIYVWHFAHTEFSVSVPVVCMRPMLYSHRTVFPFHCSLRNIFSWKFNSPHNLPPSCNITFSKKLHQSLAALLDFSCLPPHNLTLTSSAHPCLCFHPGLGRSWWPFLLNKLFLGEDLTGPVPFWITLHGMQVWNPQKKGCNSFICTTHGRSQVPR